MEGEGFAQEPKSVNWSLAQIVDTVCQALFFEILCANLFLRVGVFFVSVWLCVYVPTDKHNSCCDCENVLLHQHREQYSTLFVWQ